MSEESNDYSFYGATSDDGIVDEEEIFNEEENEEVQDDGMQDEERSEEEEVGEIEEEEEEIQPAPQYIEVDGKVYDADKVKDLLSRIKLAQDSYRQTDDNRLEVLKRYQEKESEANRIKELLHAGDIDTLAREGLLDKDKINELLYKKMEEESQLEQMTEAERAYYEERKKNEMLQNQLEEQREQEKQMYLRDMEARVEMDIDNMLESRGHSDNGFLKREFINYVLLATKGNDPSTVKSTWGEFFDDFMNNHVERYGKLAFDRAKVDDLETKVSPETANAFVDRRIKTIPKEHRLPKDKKPKTPDLNNEEEESPNNYEFYQERI